MTFKDLANERFNEVAKKRMISKIKWSLFIIIVLLLVTLIIISSVGRKELIVYTSLIGFILICVGVFTLLFIALTSKI